jgi:hypothetical protein
MMHGQKNIKLRIFRFISASFKFTTNNMELGLNFYIFKTLILYIIMLYKSWLERQPFGLIIERS